MAEQESRGVSQSTAIEYSGDEYGEFDIRLLIDRLLEKKWMAITIAMCVLLLGVAYAFVASPVYKTDALLQIEKKPSALPGLDDVQSLFGRLTQAQAEIEILRSRSVVGRVVEQEKLTIQSAPRLFPVIGSAIARRGLGDHLPVFMGYSWGGSRIDVQRFDVPDYLKGKQFTVKALPEGDFELYSPSGAMVLSGKVGESASGEVNGDEISIFIRAMHGRVGTQFFVLQQHISNVIASLQQKLTIIEKGKQSGIISISLEGGSPVRITRILNGIINSHLRQNVERRSEEASKMLEFLDEQMPELKEKLEVAESELREYKQSKGAAVDISVEGSELLERATDIEKQLSALELERSELRLRFTEKHPILISLQSKLDQLRQSRNEIEAKLKKLPNTELESIRRIRNVEVANELYVQLLNRAQELRVAKAGTIGDARILDHAIVPLRPIKPKVILILAVSFVLAVLTGIMSVFLREALRKTLDNPDVIEGSLGLPVFATIPHSRVEESGSDGTENNYKNNVLCRLAPNDPAVESLRSFRTSLQFALFEARNNIVTIHGPTPGIGKSFVSMNLAFLLSDMDKSVLLVDADMRKGHMHKALVVKRAPGLSDVLSGQADFDMVKHSFRDERVSFLATGTIPPNPSELLMHGNFESTVSFMSQQYDYVIFDTPPTLNLADSIAIGRRSGTNFLVARSGVNTLQDLNLARKRMNQSGIVIDGVIFNDLSLAVSKYRMGGYYNYNYLK